MLNIEKSAWRVGEFSWISMVGMVFENRNFRDIYHNWMQTGRRRYPCCMALFQRSAMDMFEGTQIAGLHFVHCLDISVKGIQEMVLFDVTSPPWLIFEYGKLRS